MARFSSWNNRDIPQIEAVTIAAASAGSAADFETMIGAVPDLTVGVPSGASFMGDQNNTMFIRNIQIVWGANLTGAATNNFTVNINQYRAGAVLVNTTSSTTITAGVNTVTPASMAGLYNGQALTFSGGTGAAETVYIYNLTSTTFQALFANGHSGAYTIVSAPLASVTYASGTNDSKWVPRNFGPTTMTQKVNYIQRNDVLTFARVSSNSTGLASPVAIVQIDWIPSGPKRS